MKRIVTNSIPMNNNDFWFCNFNTASVDAFLKNYTKIPRFWQDVIRKWSELNFHSPSNLTEIMNSLIWFNSHILNGKREMIFYKKWYEASIFKISDIIINGRLSTFE